MTDINVYFAVLALGFGTGYMSTVTAFAVVGVVTHRLWMLPGEELAGEMIVDPRPGDRGVP